MFTDQVMKIYISIFMPFLHIWSLRFNFFWLFIKYGIGNMNCILALSTSDLNNLYFEQGNNTNIYAYVKIQ